MKKISFLLIVVLLVSVLAACANTSSAPASDPAAGSPAAAQGTPDPAVGAQQDQQIQDRDLPDSFRLALGTLKLEESAYAVNQQQAQAMLPYWKALSALSQSDTAAIQEVEAVLKQIQAQMSAEQLTAIDGMEMSMADLASLTEKLGLTNSQEGMPANGSLTDEERATRQAACASGQIPQGGVGPGGGMGPGSGGGGEIPGGGVPLPNVTQSASGFGGGAGMNLGINPRLLALVIEFLELRAAG